MNEPKHSREELKHWQSLPLEVKILMTKDRIRQWVKEYGEDKVYISFSGGKDSTVLLHIARQMYPDIKAMFVDIPTQYPELKQFAMTWDNVDIVKSSMGYIQVVEKYGFPFFSKEISQVFYEVESCKRHGRESCRIKQLDGNYVSKNGKTTMNVYGKYKFMLNSPFAISHMCCNVMKKQPAKKYEKETGRKPILATMAVESTLRAQKWMQNGCNAFDIKRPVSTPMSFWTEQDVLSYIKVNQLTICSVYGDVVKDISSDGIVGQLTISDMPQFEDTDGFDADSAPLKTTGCYRTGCVLCGFGCQAKSDTRFVDLRKTHPGIYGLIDKIQNNGVTMRQAIDWINENGGFDIKY